ncbi:Rieske 2Fe-2S domain-containing protein [Candidatus Kapabacteria bacterium]|nr:Rieske 2Fe-2S domain-containing protein [Candidatus Kapabacteria bacterium]
MILFPIELINGKEYLKVFPSSEILNRRGKKIQYDDEDEVYEVAVFKIDGKFYCVQNHCPHQHAPKIFEGTLDSTKVTCPLHGWSYQLEDGSNCDPRRGLRSLQTFDIIEKNAWVYIEKPKIEIPKWRR